MITGPAVGNLYSSSSRFCPKLPQPLNWCSVVQWCRGAVWVMRRSTSFANGRLPLQHNPNLQPSLPSARGPIAFLNPTALRFGSLRGDGAPKEHGTPHPDGTRGLEGEDATYKWTTRNNRKGRHQLEVIPARDRLRKRFLTPLPTSSPHEIARNVGRMFTQYPVWDISWLVAYIFVWGSIVWIINAL